MVRNTSDQKMLLDSLKSPLEHYDCGVTKEKSNISKQQEVTEDTVLNQHSILTKKNFIINQSSLQENTSVTVESQPYHKKKIWKDKLSISDVNTLATKSLKILDQASTSKGKVLTPFWTTQSKEISEKLWLPTKIDYVDSVLNLSTESSKAQMGKSWFSIKKKHPQKKNSLMTSFQSSQFSLVDSMDSEATPLKSKLKKQPQIPLKTLKIRLFPNIEEKEKLKVMFDQFRWYYNSTLSIVYQHYGYDKITETNKYSNTTIRDLIRRYRYTEEKVGHLNFQSFEYDENRNEGLLPPWWSKKEVFARLPRGASDKFTSSLNSAISNFKSNNINHFNMKFMTKKKPTDYLHFEDKSFPSFIRKIKSNYWFTTREGKRKRMSFSDIKTTDKGIEIIYEKETGKYFLHYPVDINWFPEEDRRNDSQVKFIYKGDRVISLDPGVENFLLDMILLERLYL